MKKKFGKYWEQMNIILAIASIFDPRYKLSRVKYFMTKIYGKETTIIIVDEICQYVHAMYNEYNLKCKGGQFIPTGESGVTNNEFDIDTGMDNEAELDQFMNEDVGGSNDRNELETYLNDSLAAKQSSFDILKWWEFNEAKYPVVAQMAKDILAIPVSTVASESSFSTGGRAVHKFRSTLNTKTVEALICSQDWIRHTMPDNETEQKSNSVVSDIETMRPIDLDHHDDDLFASAEEVEEIED